MTSPISSLYAEIGFKVKDDELKEFVSKLNELNNVVKSIKSNLTSLNSLNLPKLDISGSLQQSSAIKAEENAKAKKRKQESIEDDKRRERTNKKFLVGLGAVLTAATGYMKKSFSFLPESASGAKIATDFSRLTGDDIKSLQYWTALSAATGTGLSRDDMANQLIAIREKYNELIRGGGDASAYHFLGITADQSTDEMLKNMRNVFRGLETEYQKQQFASAASKIGLNPAAYMRMFGATQEQEKRALELQSRMLSSEGISQLDKLYTKFDELGTEANTLKDKFSKGFSDIDFNGINVLLKSMGEKGKEISIGERAEAWGEATGIISGSAVLFGKGLLEALESPGLAIAETQNAFEKGIQIDKDYYDSGLDWVKKMSKENPNWGGLLSGVLTAIPGSYYAIGRLRGSDASTNLNDNRHITINVKDAQTGIDMANGLNPSYGNTTGDVYLGVAE